MRTWLSASLSAGLIEKKEVAGRGRIDRGRGFDKGAVKGAKGVSGLPKWPSGAPDFN